MDVLMINLEEMDLFFQFIIILNLFNKAKIKINKFKMFVDHLKNKLINKIIIQDIKLQKEYQKMKLYKLFNNFIKMEMLMPLMKKGKEK